MGVLGKRIDAALSGKGYYLIIGAILLFALIFRTLYLSADPPAGITRSQDFSTDPFQYVYFAKNAVETGVANPFNDLRFSQWEKSSQNLAAWLVFTIAGTGRAEGNFVGVIFNLLSILFLALAIKNFGSRLASAIFVLLATFDFTLIWFARTPFLEASQNFWICLSIYFFSLAKEKSNFYLAAGLACATAAFFGKMLALFMVGSFAAVFILLFLTEREQRKQTTQAAVRFGIGFGVIAVVWLFYIFLPSRSQVSGYVAEQALGLYGAPKALDSVNDFCWQYMSLLWDSEFFQKLPIVAILAFLSGAALLAQLSKRLMKRAMTGAIESGSILIMLWFAIGYLALFPWNYRPLRYQTTLMFPAMALAAMALGYCLNPSGGTERSGAKPKRDSASNRFPWLLPTLWGVWLLPLISLIVMGVGSLSGSRGLEQSIRQGSLKYALLYLIIGAVIALAFGALRKSSGAVKKLIPGLALLCIVVFLGVNAASFVNWIGERQYSMYVADRDLGVIVNQGAVISGSYAAALTQENKHRCFMHMFGVAKPDKELFNRTPATHLIIDDGNEKRAREDYKGLMDKSVFLSRYFIRGVPVMLYDISQATANEEARKYIPTAYEMAQRFIADNSGDSAEFYMRRFLSDGKPNYSAEFYVADALNSAGEYDQAVAHYQKVQEFAPRDPVSAYNLGYAYLAAGGEQQNVAYFDSALTYLKIARTLFNQDKKLLETVEQLERRKR